MMNTAVHRCFRFRLLRRISGDRFLYESYFNLKRPGRILRVLNMRSDLP